MTLHYQDDWLTVYHGDCKTVMAEMEPESVHCVVTSPPYWGLRDYGDPGQLGLEPTPDEYVANMVAVFREVRRVLRADGTVWLNLGDSYASGGSGSWGSSDKSTLTTGSRNGAWAPGKTVGTTPAKVAGLAQKQLVGIPWRVAFALQGDGWYLRSDIIWSKPNPMPESVTDRPTKSHEYLFLLSKSARYYFDADAVQEGLSPTASYGGTYRNPQKNAIQMPGRMDEPPQTLARPGKTIEPNPAGRNIRSVWTIATAPYPGAHFATFPPKLVEPCIKAGTSEKGVCPECGAPWERVVERPEATLPDRRGPKYRDKENDGTLRRSSFHVAGWREATPDMATTTGWRPTCTHVSPLPPQPPVVLDCFAGSGTTGMVAQSLSRRAVLIDLSLDYLGQLMDRNADIPLGLGA